MTAVSEEELNELRSENEKLREQIAKEEAKEAENNANRQREYEARQLAAENARLEAQLASAKARSKVGVSREGAQGLMESAEDQFAAAQAALENPQGVPVDVNDPENIKKKDTGTVASVQDGKVKIKSDGTATVTSGTTTSTNGSGSSNTGSNGGNS